MVFTHLPSNVLLILVPLMPNLSWAVGFTVTEVQYLSNGRSNSQAYTIAVVRPDERSAAAGITGVARSVGASISAMLGIMLVGSTGLMSTPSFFLAGALKILYDLLLYRAFSNRG